MTPSILAYLNVSYPFILKTDASGTDLGGILSPIEEQVIAYWNCQVNVREELHNKSGHLGIHKT